MWTVVLWEAGYKDINERPVLSCGVKGIVYVELHARGANRDLHSANAAVVPNPGVAIGLGVSDVERCE